MQPQSKSPMDVPVPDSVGGEVLSIAIVGPDGRLRKELAVALQRAHEGQIREFSSYPPGLDDVPRLLEQQHDVILIELDSNPEYALDLVEGVCAHRTATVMLYSNYSDPELGDPDLLVRCMRAGAREFLSKPFTEASVAEAMIRAVARRATNRSQKKTGGRLLVFCGVKGGSGVTSIACNFAVALAEAAPHEDTLLLDMDVPLGDASLLLGVTPQYTTIDALENHKRLDSSFFTKLLVKHSSGVQVLAAPGKMVGLTPAPDAIESLIRIARQDFNNVVVDLGAKRDFRGTALMDQASTIYLVTQPGVSELRNANRLITDYFEDQSGKLEIILNRYQPRGNAVSDENIRRALTKPAYWKVPNDYLAVRRMQTAAKPLIFSDSPIAGVITKMARTLYGLPDLPEKKKGFALRRFGRASEVDSDEPSEITRLGLSGLPDEEESTSATAKSVDEADAEQSADNTQKRSEVRVFKGQTYVRGEDGQWYLQEADEEERSTEPIVITWPAPEAIEYGTALSDEQYNPSASISGRFDFTPAPGFVLPAGTHTLWATFTPEKRADKTPIQSGVSILVKKATPSITWDTPADIPFGTPLSELQLAAASDIPGAFAYSHTEGDVLGEGQHEISVIFSPEDTNNYTDAAASVTLLVTKPVPKVTWSTPSGLVYGAPLGPEQLNAVASVAGTFDYSPAEGTVLPAGEHTLTVKFTPEDGEAYGIAQAAVLLNVAPAMPEIIWRTPSTIPFGLGLSEIQFNATSSVPGTFEYSPGEGEILAAGQHTLSAYFTPDDDHNYSAASATVEILVAKSKPAINWPVPASITYGTPLSERQLNATSPVPGKFRYVPGLGAVLAAGKHMPCVIFTPDDLENFSQAQCTVPLTVTRAIPSIHWAIPARVPYGTPVSSTQLCASASVPGTFVYKPNIGEILPVGEHALTVTFTPSDTTNYTPVQSTVPLAVSEAVPPSIEWSEPEAIVYGTPLSDAQLKATASVDGEYAYRPGLGEVLVAGRHLLSVTFTAADTNLPAAEANVTLVVTKATPVIQWNDPGSIAYGTTLSDRQLNATCNVPGTFQYKPGLGEVLEAGKRTLSVLFLPSDKNNFTEAKAKVTIKVDKAIPSIIWQTPEKISYGTPLSQAQLKAQASVPGTITYVPAEGTVLTAGKHVLIAHFSPTDTANYGNAQSSVTLQVDGFDSISEPENALVAPYGPSEFRPTTEPAFVEPSLTLSGQRGRLASSSAARLQPSPPQRGNPVLQPDSTNAARTPRPKTADGNIPAAETPLETRSYKGNTYVKGADGQWHLLKQ